MEIYDIIKIVKSHQQGDDVSENPMVTMATKLEISEKNYNLIGHRYKAVDKVDYSIVEMSYIESYQKIIDGAKQIVDNHRTMIQINPEWEKVKLGDVCIVNPSKTEVQDLDNDTMVSFVLVEDINKNKMLFTTIEEKQLGEVYGGYSFFKDYDLLLPSIWASFKNGKSALAKDLKNGIGFCSSTCFVLRAKECILPEILYCYINSHKFIDDGKRSMGLDESSRLRRIKKNF